MTKEPVRPPDAQSEIIHASCVALNGRAVLIRGPSGSGKSGLSLSLLAYGAGLVADDCTCLWRDGDQLMADAPERLRDLIEARQVGLLRVPSVGEQPVVAVIDMGEEETERLPHQSTTEILGCCLPRLRKSYLPYFPAAIVAYLKGGRHA